MKDNLPVVGNIVDNIRRIYQILNEKSKKVERETGITGPQLWAIKVISEASSIRVLDLARRLYLHPATVIGILDRLEAKDLVNRRRSSEDRRVVYVSLTEKGADLVASAPEVMQGPLVSGLEHLSASSLSEINRSLNKLVRILGIQGLPPKLIGSREINAPTRLNQAKKTA